jgi:hypothetical protein
MSAGVSVAEQLDSGVAGRLVVGAGRRVGDVQLHGGPQPPGAERETGIVEFAQALPEVGLGHLDVGEQVLDRAALGRLCQRLVYVPSLPWLDVQGGGVGCWHGASFHDMFVRWVAGPDPRKTPRVE